mgnify:CR=1 FL=1
MTLLESKLDGVKLAIYEKLEPALRSGVESLSKLVDVISYIVDHSDGFVGALTVMGSALAAYLAYTTAIKVMEGGFMSLAIVQKAVAAAQALMNAVMAANPIGLVVAAIAARFASPWLDGVFQSWFKLPDSTVVTLVASYFVVFFLVE